MHKVQTQRYFWRIEISLPILCLSSESTKEVIVASSSVEAVFSAKMVLLKGKAVLKPSSTAFLPIRMETCCPERVLM
jgi:hypothetical protein